MSAHSTGVLSLFSPAPCTEAATAKKMHVQKSHADMMKSVRCSPLDSFLPTHGRVSKRRAEGLVTRPPPSDSHLLVETPLDRGTRTTHCEKPLSPPRASQRYA